MRSLYWKIFLSFWLATILIIITTAWITSQIATKSSIPAREQLFMDSYANAAVATFESGKREALVKWLEQTGLSRHMALFLISSTGEIIGSHEIPGDVREISRDLIQDQLHEGIFKKGNMIVSHEILSTSGKAYRLAAVSEKPLSNFVAIPWGGLTIRLTIAVFFSGLICYLLSVYLTQPLSSLRLAAKSIATGKLSTRVGTFRGHHNDEIAELSREFDRMAEKLETMVKSKERLLQDISHELRSPLARLHIAIELGRNKTSELAEAEFNRMETECNRLNMLIGEILEFARLDKSVTQLKMSKVDLSDVLNRIIDDANFEYSGINVRAEARDLKTCYAMVDERLIHRAVENILRNALKYSPSEKPVIVTMHCNSENNNIEIKIKDRGPGVPEAQLKKIFNPFYRVDSSREKRTGGYGLGLAIASQAIKLHDGTITAKNREKGGLCVSICLPLK